MPTVETPVGRFSYLERGDRDAPLVLCLHGFPDHPRSFEPMMEIVKAAGYRAVAPWMRGYAPSVHEGPYHIDQLGRDATEIARALSPDRPVAVVGHDWGAIATYGAVAGAETPFRCAVTMAVPHPLAFAVNTRSHPSQLRRSWYMMFFQLPGVPERVVPRRNFAFIDRLWRAWSPGFVLPAERRDELKRCLAASMPAPINYYRALFRPLGEVMRRIRVGNSLKRRIGVPLLNLQGANDGCIAPALGDGQERFFDGPFETGILPGVGHFMQLEDPDLVGQRVVGWLRRYHVDS